LKTTKIPDSIISGLTTEEELVEALDVINLNDETYVKTSECSDNAIPNEVLSTDISGMIVNNNELLQKAKIQ
jgi:hypothetical protein